MDITPLQRIELPGGWAPSALCLGVADWYGERDLDRLYCMYREAGGNCFDAAHCYAYWVGQEGTPERNLGRLVCTHDRREDVLVCTKGCHISCGDSYPRPERYMTPEIMIRDLHESLDRLGMDHVDLYYLHRDDPVLGVGEIMDALHEQRAKGLVSRYGASNWRAARIVQANEYARRHGIEPFAASQVLWNLGCLTKPMPPDLCVMDDTEEAWYRGNRLPVFAYSSTANGYFAAGKSTHGDYDNEASQRRRARVLEQARRRGTTPNRIALAWLLSHPWPVFPLLGTTNPAHLADALGAARITLDEGEVEALAADANGETTA